MTLLPPGAGLLDEAWVALDLETTGLSSDEDQIIEVGAVRFRGHETLDTFQSLVNPGRRLDPFVTRLTGITNDDLRDAPGFSSVAAALAAFVGRSPLVGHNIGFDLGFLDRQGFRTPNRLCDTWELAYFLLPRQPSYALDSLAGWAGAEDSRYHRAVDDAHATRRLFVRLLEDLAGLDVNSLAEIGRMAARSPWIVSDVLRLQGLTAARVAAPDSGTGVSGVDTGELSKRLRHGRALRANERRLTMDPELAASLLMSGSPLAEAIDGFEERVEQAHMARAVARAINGGHRLMVEAGTGVGKSLAYLLPAAMYALENNRRVVVSTNTINLQEQLLTKDVPALVRGLGEVDGLQAEDLRFAQLKGRANYLCFRRWDRLRSSDALTAEEARMVAKTLVWMGETATGDRSELNLGHREAAAPWDRLSAQGAVDCPRGGTPCFLRAAREKAAASHLVIVNHALLLSDLTSGGALIPEHDVLVIDEAHHLEREATRHLGFELGHSRFGEYVDSLIGDGGLLAQAVNAFRGTIVAETRRNTVEQTAQRALPLLPRLREAAALTYATLLAVVSERIEERGGYAQELRITRTTRAQPTWSDLETQWQNVDLLLMDVEARLGELNIALDGLEDAELVNYDGLMAELASARQTTSELRRMLREFVAEPLEDGIYWVTRSRQSADLTMHYAPLHVGPLLDEMLFSRKESVIMTSATLSTAGTFDHVVERTGFTESERLLLGSPFDYPRAALLCVPNDMPEPNSWAYQSALEQAVTDSVLAAGGRTMALFTSHASLQATAAQIRNDLEARGINVLAQGVDGTPGQLVRRFRSEPKSLLLGTASFWEGVDLPGDSLQVLLLARLPFNVPTEPVFEARSEQYEDSFSEYALPEAALRLRQGFGRLIRTRTDRGVVVILDRRVVSRRYGQVFLDSLPDVTLRNVSVIDLDRHIQNWLEVK